jgi:hypothetical protein
MATDLQYDDWWQGGQGQSLVPQQFDQMAQELAKKAAPPAPGSLQNIMQMLGAVKGYGDERMDMQKAAMSRHYVNPPVVPGGSGRIAQNVPELQTGGGAKQRAPIPTLGMLLGGGR